MLPKINHLASSPTILFIFQELAISKELITKSKASLFSKIGLISLKLIHSFGKLSISEIYFLSSISIYYLIKLS
jgi:hypothetical protein